MTQLQINILKQGDKHPDPIPDEMWLIESNIEKSFLIERATILDLEDGRYPQIQLIAKDPATGKFIVIGTTMRLLKGVLTIAEATALKRGLTDF